MRSEVVVQAASAADAERLSLVGRASFLETFAGVLDGRDVVAFCVEEHSPAWYDAAIRGGAAVWLATLGEAPIGYAVVDRPSLPVKMEPRDLELKRIYLLAPWHGTGIARRLLSEVKEHAIASAASRLLLGVYAGNERALSFYRREGFERIGERSFRVGDKAYGDVVHALTLSPGT